MTPVKLGKYLHFKGAEVEVLLEAHHSETLEEMMVYKHLDTGETWVRPKKMFLGKVVVGGKKVAQLKYGSKEWWVKANSKAANDFAKGDYKAFNLTDRLVTELRKRSSHIGPHDRVLKTR